jgi:hypothetical protein
MMLTLQWKAKGKITTPKKKPHADDFCTTGESDNEDWVNSPSPVVKPQSVKSRKGKSSPHGSNVVSIGILRGFRRLTSRFYRSATPKSLNSSLRMGIFHQNQLHLSG